MEIVFVHQTVNQITIHPLLGNNWENDVIKRRNVFWFCMFTATHMHPFPFLKPATYSIKVCRLKE